MEFLIADTFTDSLARLTGDEQKAVKMTAFDLQLNPVNPGMSFHKLDKAQDKNFWSVRVNRDIRLIIHKGHASLLLCYVNHHDKAYDWAKRRKLQTHPKTGAAQLVEIRETVQEVIVPTYKVVATKPPLFTEFSDDELLGHGVPAEWLNDVRSAPRLFENSAEWLRLRPRIPPGQRPLPDRLPVRVVDPAHLVRLPEGGGGNRRSPDQGQGKRFPGCARSRTPECSAPRVEGRPGEN